MLMTVEAWQWWHNATAHQGGRSVIKHQQIIVAGKGKGYNHNYCYIVITNKEKCNEQPGLLIALSS